MAELAADRRCESHDDGRVERGETGCEAADGQLGMDQVETYSRQATRMAKRGRVSACGTASRRSDRSGERSDATSNASVEAIDAVEHGHSRQCKSTASRPPPSFGRFRSSGADARSARPRAMSDATRERSSETQTARLPSGPKKRLSRDVEYCNAESHRNQQINEEAERPRVASSCGESAPDQRAQSARRSPRIRARRRTSRQIGCDARAGSRSRRGR